MIAPRDKVATIVPLAHLDLTKHHMYFMALSYICDREEYVSFFRSRSREGKYVILDNSTVELGQPEPFEAYVQKAIDMEASCIVLPDWLHDRERTIKDAVYGIRVAHHMGYRGQLMGVPQGADKQEWTDCCREMEQLGVGVLGLSYRYNDMFPRAEAVSIALKRTSRSLHLLGCRMNPIREAAPLLRHARVKGVDSAFAAAITKSGETLISSTERTPGVSADIREDLYPVHLMRENLVRYRVLCSGMDLYHQ